MHQSTISAPTPWIAGPYLDAPGSGQIRFHPAPENSGFVFERADIAGRPSVRAQWEHVRSMPRWTALERDGVWVHHTEHVLAALILAGIDNAIIEMNSDRIPMLEGGSCAGFARALLAAGRRSQSARRRVFTLSRPMFYHDPVGASGGECAVPTLEHGRYVAALPADGLSLSYVFHWPTLPSLPIGIAEYESSRAGDISEFLEARSYLVETELTSVQNLLGPVHKDVMLLTAGCDPSLALEAARHKVVDFIGDMGVLGHPLRGRYVAFRTGHRIHHAFVRAMMNAEALHLVEELDP